MTAKHAANTLRSYACAWGLFECWCREAGRASLPATAETCVEHAACCLAAGRRLETVQMRLKAINHYHRQKHLAAPADASVARFLCNARRLLCEPPQGKHAITPEHLTRICARLDQRRNPIDIRDRAMLLLCFAAGWRRSELTSLDTKDIRWVTEGITLRLARSKTDQEGRGRSVGIQYGESSLTCPIRALNEWIAARGPWPGPLFVAFDGYRRLTRERLSADGVRRAVKCGIELIGEDATAYSAHSLRAGMITAAAENGATETAIMQRTGHRSYEMIRRYIRPVEVFRSNPLKGVL